MSSLECADFNVIVPDWPAPANVKALQTTRLGGVSRAPFASLNLGAHVDDDPISVAKNRQFLNRYLPSEPLWLNQVHGPDVLDAAQAQAFSKADASFATQKNVVCGIMTADCLPILLCDQAGTVVAAVHAGWRGLCGGVIEATVNQLPVNTSEILAWLGPAIGSYAFEVGEEVRAQFMVHDKRAAQAFTPYSTQWLCDLYLLAQQRLRALGVTHIYGGSVNEDFCTYRDEARFFSFRRDKITGRMASLIYLS